jgi:3-dehydroquinate synthase
MDFRYLHGECVSIGCIMASILSYNKGLIDKAALDRIIGLIVSLSFRI